MLSWPLPFHGVAFSYNVMYNKQEAHEETMQTVLVATDPRLGPFRRLPRGLVSEEYECKGNK